MAVISSQQNNKQLFIKTPYIKLKLVLALTCALGLMVVDKRTERLQWVRASLNNLVAPLQYLVDAPVRAVGWVGQNISSRTALIDNNMQLRYSNMRLQAQLQKLLILQKENSQLRQLLKSSPRNDTKVIAAQILAVNSSEYRSIVVLNKGSNDKVYVGQPVLDAYGLMGQVIEVNSDSSRVLLINDATSGIPVQNNRTGERTILVGNNAFTPLSLINLPNNSDIEQGDLLVTSGLAGRFAEGYPVAKVTSIESHDSASFMTIKAQPVAKLNRSRLVLLAWINQ